MVDGHSLALQQHVDAPTPKVPPLVGNGLHAIPQHGIVRPH